MCTNPSSTDERTRVGETKDLAKGTQHVLAGGPGMQLQRGPWLFLLLQPRTDEGKREDISVPGCHPASCPVLSPNPTLPPARNLVSLQ